MENTYGAFVYKWTRDDGEFYIGVRKGHPGDGYIGSGRVFRAKYDKDPSRWNREILSYWPTFKDALLEEARLVTQDVLDDSLSCNLQLGGNGGCSPQSIAALPKGGDHWAAKRCVIKLMVDQRPIPRTGSAGRPAHGKRSWNDPIVASGAGITISFAKENGLCRTQLQKTGRPSCNTNHTQFYYIEWDSE